MQEEFSIVTTTKDRNGIVYVSTAEARKFPFTGTQWHPEKVGPPRVPQLTGREKGCVQSVQEVP